MKRSFLFYVFGILVVLLVLESSTNLVFAEHNKKHVSEILEKFNQQIINDKLTIALFNAAWTGLNLQQENLMEVLYYHWIYPKLLNNKKNVSKVLVVDSSNKLILNLTELYESETKGSTNLIVVAKALQKIKDETRKLTSVPKVKIIIVDT